MRIIRYTGLLLICILAGLYANILFFAEQPRRISEDAGPLNRTTSSIQETAPAVTKLPEFSLVDLNGENRSISEWADRPLLINFWATWCAPCRREMPMLQTLQQERQNRPFEVIGIAIDRQNDVELFISETGVTYPILVGQSDAMEAAEKFGPAFIALPFTVFTAPGGEILHLHSGELHLEQLRQILPIVDDVTEGLITAAEARKRLSLEPIGSRG